MEKKRPQEWYVDSLTRILKDRNKYVGYFGKNTGYTYVLKAFMDKYSNTFYDSESDKLFNMYWDSFKPENIDTILRSIIVSKGAYDYLTTGNIEGKKIGKTLHLEHMTPMSYSRSKILNLDKIDYPNVKECFKYAVVALITKEEKKILDSNQVVTPGDLEVLEELRCKYPNEISEREIQEAKNLRKEKLSSHGNGLIRLIHLYNNAVLFVNKDGVELGIESLYEMLKNNNFTLNQY